LPQEIKATEDQIPTQDITVAGYPYHTISATKKGYSGVAILSKIEPKNCIRN
jgi:exodeoxyribonuclease-3